MFLIHRFLFSYIALISTILFKYIQGLWYALAKFLFTKYKDKGLIKRYYIPNLGFVFPI